eukprot:SAG11_NODE_53_length_19648_cov_14.691902_11_plen_127_part_00
MQANGQSYPSNSGWKCWEGGFHGGDDSVHWSQVSQNWHGLDGPNGWELPGFVDYTWPYAHSLGRNGGSPWGDVNREMGMDSQGTISPESEWIWTAVSLQVILAAILVVLSAVSLPKQWLSKHSKYI